jgi:DNA-binding NarL/FixJ family response regulator
MMSHKSTSQARREYRVGNVHSNELTREGIALVVKQEKGFSVCGSAANKTSAFALAEQQRPDVLLVEFHTGDCDILHLVKELRACCPKTRVIVIGLVNEELYGDRLLRAGAATYLAEKSSAADLVRAIRQVVESRRELPQRALRNGKPVTEDKAHVSRLTDRELHVFTLIGRGLAPARSHKNSASAARRSSITTNK